ncbi:class I SAM-dependent methyltransferase [Desulfolucanica intricata]|uniref:class I SAM-dependent methyltransferase n=1 Tax=Desulfolucanica intricata TaxID=1285191 RepID=UPI0013520A35|nr:class I SAM-dependent methyltransferase [Desulfolucanica intricata]
MNHKKRNPTFDDIAAKYDLWSKVPLGKLCRKLEDEVFFKVYGGIKDSGPVLDIGCGTGDYVVYLAKHGLAVTGIDPSRNMLAIAHEKVHKKSLNNVSLIQCQAQNLPFEDNSFKTVICSLALEFTGNPERVIKEVYRVLKPSGQFVLAFLNSWSPLNISRKIKGIFCPSIYHSANFMSKHYVNLILKKQGFTEFTWDRAICFPLIDKYFFINSLYNGLENLGKKLLPFFSAYIVVKVKKI